MKVLLLFLCSSAAAMTYSDYPDAILAEAPFELRISVPQGAAYIPLTEGRRQRLRLSVVDASTYGIPLQAERSQRSERQMQLDAPGPQYRQQSIDVHQIQSK